MPTLGKLDTPKGGSENSMAFLPPQAHAFLSHRCIQIAVDDAAIADMTESLALGRRETDTGNRPGWGGAQGVGLVVCLGQTPIQLGRREVFPPAGLRVPFTSASAAAEASTGGKSDGGCSQRRRSTLGVTWYGQSLWLQMGCCPSVRVQKLWGATTPNFTCEVRRLQAQHLPNPMYRGTR